MPEQRVGNKGHLFAMLLLQCSAVTLYLSLNDIPLDQQAEDHHQNDIVSDYIAPGIEDRIPMWPRSCYYTPIAYIFTLKIVFICLQLSCVKILQVGITGRDLCLRLQLRVGFGYLQV